MTEKLINLAEFNRAETAQLGDKFKKIDDRLHIMEPKPKALFIDSAKRARPMGPDHKELFAFATAYRVHSATTDNLPLREAVLKVIETLPDHTEKIKKHLVKPYPKKR